MNREIKFRAWNKKKGIMNYDNEDGTEDYWDGIYTSEIGMVNALLNMPDKGELYSISSFRNKYEVMQYTGLKDKNGVEIYEGDVLDKQGHWGYYVGFKNESFVAIPLDKVQRINWEWHGIKACVDNEFEVIGNIYENPELLEAEQWP